MADEMTQVQCSRCAHKKVCSMMSAFMEAHSQISNFRVTSQNGTAIVQIPLRNFRNIMPVVLQCTEFLHENAHYNVRGEK